MKHPSKKRQFTGTVVSNKMNKTVVVEIARVTVQPKYRKRYTRVVKFKAHDEKNSCQPGEIVTIQECKPISKEKSWRVIKK